MSEGQSHRSVASSAQHRQETEVDVVEERERAAVETATAVARAVSLVMAELAAARAEVEAVTATDAAHAAAAELETLHGSSISSSISADGGTDDELKLAREAAREQEAQWVAAHPRGAMAAAQTGVDMPVVLCTGGRAAAVPPTAAAAQTGVDALAAGPTEIVAFTGGAALPHRTGTMVTAGSSLLSRTSVPTLGGLPSPRPTTSSGAW
jgi:hypothetical protein